MPGERTLLLRNATVVATMDAARREIENGWVLVRGHMIAAVGAPPDVPAVADEVIDCRGLAVLPGLVNTHHHFFQTLTRGVPAAQDAELFAWLRALYPVWARLTPEMLNVSAQVAAAELMLSGCTTASDHLYLFPNGSRLDDTIEAARTLGLRFHACRGSMSVGESAGGLPPDALVEDEAAILRDTRRVIEAFHDPARFAMLRIAAAPCSPFSVSRDLMRETATLAAAYGVRLHTHLAENDNDVAYSRERFGCSPAEFAEQLGWTGPQAWHAHCVKLDDRGIDLFARTGPASPIARRRTCGWRRASRRCAACSTRACPSDSASTVRHPTIRRTCSPRCGRHCCCNGWASGRPHSRRARRSSSPPAAARGCWAATTSAISRPAWPRTSWPSISTSVGFAGAEADPLAALVFCAPGTRRLCRSSMVAS